MSLSVLASFQRRFIRRAIFRMQQSSASHPMSYYGSSRHFRLNQNKNTDTGFADGPEIANFSEKTLQWMVERTESHIEANADKYPFKKDEIQLLSHCPANGKALVSCTAQNTSTWFINNMLSRKEDIYVHSFTKSGKFEPLRHLFDINAVPLEKDGVMTLHDESKNVQIEHTDIRNLGMEWMTKNGFNECFDVIFDELALDTVVASPETMDDYIQTTIFGHCLKRGGVIYVCSKRMSGDIAGRKLRQRIGSLYGNSHFEMIAERDTAWHTQFLFLKAESCSNHSNDRESQRKDHWGDSHLEYNQHKIWNRSKVTENAGMGMSEGMERVYDALMNDLHDGKAPKGSSSIQPSFLDDYGETFEKF